MLNKAQLKESGDKVGIVVSAKPDKNRFSHCHDALQYAFLGGGEGRKVMLGGQRASSSTVVERISNPFDRMKRRNTRFSRKRAI